METVVRGAALVAQPWPNGKGITRYIHRHDAPEGGFWLIGLAELPGDAPFSHFPDGDRIFTLIEGPRCTLTLDGAPLPCLPMVPASFPGDVPTACFMHGTPGVAFNLMLDRRHFAGQVLVRSIAAGHAIGTLPSTVAVHCLQGQLQIGDTLLQPGDTILPGAAVSAQAVAGSALSLIVAVSARAAV